MQNQVIDVLIFQPRVRQRLPDRVRYRPNRELKHLLAVHADVTERAAPRVRRRGVRARLARAVVHLRSVFVRKLRGQVMVPRPVAVHVEPEHAAVLRVRRGRQHHRAAAVAEQDARPAVAPVDVPREDVGADHQHVFVFSAADEVDTVHESDDEAAARGGEVERERALRADRGLDRARAAEDVVGGGRREDDEIYVFRVYPRHLQRIRRRLRRERSQGLVAAYDVPLPDPRARLDPLVVRVHERREVVVRERLLRDRHADAGDLRARGDERGRHRDGRRRASSSSRRRPGRRRPRPRPPRERVTAAGRDAHYRRRRRGRDGGAHRDGRRRALSVDRTRLRSMRMRTALFRLLRRSGRADRGV
mmetsp:Transcript_11019/g.39870  ORF Transcript_11019/g.39870 Transcript_11019/m.39870 type:complete len:362 (+) Transcript_11019:365-1450(+)